MLIYPELHFFKKIYRRIISVVPSQTELLYDLGLEEEVIAITKFCVHPLEWFHKKTKAGGTKNLNMTLIKALSPDLIIANKEENTKEQIEELASLFDVYVSDVKNITEAIAMINDIGILTGTKETAINISDGIESKYKNLQQSFCNKRKIKAAYLIWKDPYMAAGNDTFINDMLSYCALENIYGNIERYPQIELKEMNLIIESNTGFGLTILSSEPYPFKQKHVHDLCLQLPSSKIILADGEMFSWYGSRLLQAADYFEKFRSDVETLFNQD